MFAKLKAQATAAASAAAEQAQKTASDVKARVDTGVAAKKLLDEGGQGMETKLIAKQASRNASSADTAFVFNFRKVVDAYQEAAPTVKTAGVLQSLDQQAFQTLGEAYAQRATKLEQALVALKPAPTPTNVSAVETDAITMLTTKLQAMGLGSKIQSSIPSSSGDATNEEGDKRGFMEKAQEKAKQVSDRASQRLDNAQRGKKLVDEGGEEVKVTLLAKKASIDATTADKTNLGRLRKAIDAYKDAETKLKEAQSEDKGDETPSFASVIASVTERKTELEALLSKIDPAPEAVDTHESEKDAILYLTTQLNIKDATASASQAVVDAQGRIVEQTMSKAVSSATGGAVTKVPEGSGSAAVKFAKENPEQAKAALNFVADAKGAGKGGGYS